MAFSLLGLECLHQSPPLRLVDPALCDGDAVEAQEAEAAEAARAPGDQPDLRTQLLARLQSA